MSNIFPKMAFNSSQGAVSYTGEYSILSEDTMSDRYKQTFRGYLVDHHSPAPPVITFENLDIAEYEKFYREAGINNLMLYCKDHWGYSYYNTGIGVKHPALKTDWIAEHVPLLKILGIEFNAYYCVEYDNTASKVNPEWASLNADGSILRCTGRNAKWRIPCYMTGYREYVLGQLGEIVAQYHPDSLFLDIFGKSLCYCPSCRSAFESRNGYALPEDKDGIARHAAAIINFLDDCAEEFLDDVISTVKGIDPSIAVTINFSSHYRKSIRDKLDYHFTEPWAGNWLSAAYARATGVNPQLGPGDVSHVFDYLPATVYRQAASEIAAQGCRVFLYSEPQLPDGSLEHEESQRIGEAFQEVARFEHLLEERTHVADICIIQSDCSHAVGSEGTVVPNAIGRARAFNRHVQSILGAMKCCEYSKLTWTILPEQEAVAHGIDQFQVVVLPQVLVLEENLLRVLDAYVHSGGTVIATDETGLYQKDGKRLDDFSFAQAFGVSFTSRRSMYKQNVWGGYADFLGVRSDWGIADTTVPINEESVEFASAGEIMAKFVTPAETLGEETWVNWGYPPPRMPSTEPLVVRTRVGKGSFWYFGFDLCALGAKQLNWPRTFLAALLRKEVSTPTISLDTTIPDIVGYTAFKTLRESFIVHIVSHMPEKTGGDAPLLAPGRLKVRRGHRPISATLVFPRKEKLQVEDTGKSWSVQLPAFDIHQIVEIGEEGL
jgi:hypothetical protein